MYIYIYIHIRKSSMRGRLCGPLQGPYRDPKWLHCHSMEASVVVRFRVPIGDRSGCIAEGPGRVGTPNTHPAGWGACTHIPG